MRGANFRMMETRWTYKSKARWHTLEWKILVQ